MNRNTPLVLVILDGWGLGDRVEGNAIALADTPNWERYLSNWPHTVLKCAGEEVGLPPGQMGNSEVGHLNLGAGRIVYQDLTRITRAVRDGSFFENGVLITSIEASRGNGGTLHLMGLLSDGGVHSHISHLFALLEMAGRLDQRSVYVHAFLDGRDVPPANALEYIAALEEKLKTLGFGAVASVMGRYYAMDRDRRWERTARAYRAMVQGRGFQASSARQAVEQGYERGETDEFIQPTVIVRDDRPVGLVRDGDALVFFNFRPDRARQITRSFTDAEFGGFDRGPAPVFPDFVCLTQYDRTIEAPVAFGPQELPNTLGNVLSRHGLRQLRLAETEKYAHVTFFFNGGVEKCDPGEDRLLIPSPKVPTYDLKPEMSAREVTDTLLANMEKYDVIIVNYANPDMVGHTGDLSATVKAVEAVDECLGRVVEAVLAKAGTVLVVGDHGKAEHMCDAEGCPLTAHTCNPVPLLIIGGAAAGRSLRPGGLQDVAPTILDLLGLPKPVEMTGTSLLSQGRGIQNPEFRSGEDKER
ncbi:MAG: 2,3-bisphosphoglycerate-independent phosphoglycerate mutase [Bacillota bacterium]